MKKRFLAAVLVVLLAMSFTGCSPKDDNSSALQAPGSQAQEAPVLGNDTDEEALASIRARMKEYGYGVSVAYLGRFIEEYEGLADFFESNGFLDFFPFLADLTPERFVACEGEELYLVVPADEDAEVAVHDWIIDESTNYAGKAGTQEFYQSVSGEPFILRCNVSDIMPNTVVCISLKNQSKSLEYLPFLSLRDGSVNSQPVHETDCKVWDITPYTMLQSVESEMVIGKWEGLVIPEDGRKSYRVSLELYEDGTMYYHYSLYTEESDCAVYTYNGTWKYRDNTELGQPQTVYDFDLTLSRVIGEADEKPLEKISTTQLILNPWDDALSLQIVAGDSLYPNNWEYEVYIETAA